VPAKIGLVFLEGLSKVPWGACRAQEPSESHSAKTLGLAYWRLQSLHHWPQTWKRLCGLSWHAAKVRSLYNYAADQASKKQGAKGALKLRKSIRRPVVQLFLN
jgi:hypothetical protein